jgi:hypothetical protein
MAAAAAAAPPAPGAAAPTDIEITPKERTQRKGNKQ